MIETNVRLIHSGLEQACSQGVEDVFCLGKRRETFLKAYQEYAEHVGQMEADLCAYLKVPLHVLIVSKRLSLAKLKLSVCKYNVF